MCGIAGVFGRKDRGLVERMLGRLLHRGPDDGYLVSGEDYVLGARRLSIVGLAGGRQPLSNPSETIWAAQNGELYNFPLQKKRLTSLGHKLKTGCDTEILPLLYEEFGLDFVNHLDGMFAISIWDEPRARGILTRDRVGKKPLYYLEQDGALYYSSEIKSLLCVPGFARTIDTDSLSHYLSFKHVPSPSTIFQGIKALKPGHVLVYENKNVTVSPYWRSNWSPSTEILGLSENELIEMLLDKLRNGVKKRLMSDVPVGFFLSGGVDSSLTTALASEVSSTKIKTFTLTYHDSATTSGKELDRKWARFTKDQFDTEHYEEEFEVTNFPEQLRAIVKCFDEPFSGTISTYFLSSLIAKHVKVAISGDGADELFGSYLSHRLSIPLANYPQYLNSGDKTLLRPFSEDPSYLEQMYSPDTYQWRSKLFVFQDHEKARLFSEILPEEAASISSRLLCNEFAGLTSKEPLNRMLETEFCSIFPDQVLAFVDRLSMAHSLEIRTAFLDSEFVKFATMLPDMYKIRNGETKYLLKKAALKYFPNEMVYRKKEGFVMPINEWLRGPLESYVRETLSPDHLAKHGLFNQEFVQELVDDLYSKNLDYRHANKVLSLLIFQEWFDIYISNQFY